MEFLAEIQSINSIRYLRILNKNCLSDKHRQPH
jgi:hypothetical protein